MDLDIARTGMDITSCDALKVRMSIYDERQCGQRTIASERCMEWDGASRELLNEMHLREIASAGSAVVGRAQESD